MGPLGHACLHRSGRPAPVVELLAVTMRHHRRSQAMVLVAVQTTSLSEAVRPRAESSRPDGVPVAFAAIETGTGEVVGHLSVPVLNFEGEVICLAVSLDG